MADGHDHAGEVEAFGECITCARQTEPPPPPVPDPWPYPYGRRADQIGRVADAMKDGRWHTLAELAELTGDPEPSVSARLRDLRKVGRTVEREAIPGAGGIHRYRLLS